jgi:hypothetical protein
MDNVKVIVNSLGLDFEKKWFKTRLEKIIWLDILAFDDDFVREHINFDQKEIRTTKIIPDSFKFDGIIMMNETMITQWNPVLPKAISIQDPTFYNMFASIFDMLWEKY